jgi:fucose 4-O-acetylase-like acetyltransferase
MLILLVVIGHFIPAFGDVIRDYRVLNFFIYSFHMPLFVFVTGIFSKSFIKNGVMKYEKIISYAIFFCAYNLLHHAIFRYIGGSGAELNLLDIRNMSWYLVATSVYFLLTPLFSQLKPQIVIPFLVLLALAAGYSPQIGQFLSLSRIICFAPFFALGYYTTQERVMKFTKVRAPVRIIALLLLIAVFLLIRQFSYDLLPYRMLLSWRSGYANISAVAGGWGALYRLTAYAAAVIMSMLFLWIVPLGRVFITKLGGNTLQVYLLHHLVADLLNVFLVWDMLKSLFTDYPVLQILPLLISIAVAFALSLRPPFGYLISWVDQRKYGRLRRRS